MERIREGVRSEGIKCFMTAKREEWKWEGEIRNLINYSIL
jgi:hypothetical protein